MRMVKQTVNEDDQGARHLFFGDEEGSPGTLITCLEYPQLEPGTRGRGLHPPLRPGGERRGGAGGWRDYLTAQGVACTEVMDRTFFQSIYLRDPDGHIVELATRGPASTPDA